jgi:aromatase
MARTKTRTVTTTHTAFVAAPPAAAYALVAEATHWPYLFPTVVHVERLARGPTEDRLRLWMAGNGAVRVWTSRRSLDRHGLRIRFRQESPSPPVASMAGEWVLVPLPRNATSVVLLHEFRAIDEDPANTALIKQAVDRTSTAELAALKRIAELGDGLSPLLLSFADSVTVKAAPGPVYRFLYRAQDWPRRLPHVSRLILDEAVPNVQTVEMDVGGADGSVDTSRLVRVCFPPHSIVYKQTQPPAIISAHVGGWHLHPTADGVTVTARNTVLIRPDRAAEVLGQRGGVQATGDLIRHALRKNCLTTLLHAKDAAEGNADTGNADEGLTDEGLAEQSG